MLTRARCLGDGSGRWATQMIAVRGIEGVRVLQGFLSLAKKYPANVINQAGNRALEAACFRLRPLRQLCQRYSQDQKELSFSDKHPIIRPLSEYQNLLAEPPLETPSTALSPVASQTKDKNATCGNAICGQEKET